MEMAEQSELNTDESIIKRTRPRENDVSVQNVKDRKTFRCIYYFCFFLLCIVLVIQLQKAIRFYLAYPTYTKSHLVRQSQAAFPALSICSDSTNFNERVLQVRHKRSN